jgi:hypothetical protein
MFKKATRTAFKEEQTERAIGNARIFFASMVLLLQMAVLSAKGVETHWPVINRTTPPLNKWVWGGLALVFLIWAMITLLTAYSSRLGKSKLGTIVKESFSESMIFALAITGIGWVQGFVLAIQAGLDEWYVLVVIILGFAFYIMLAVFPLHRKLRR